MTEYQNLENQLSGNGIVVASGFAAYIFDVLFGVRQAHFETPLLLLKITEVSLSIQAYVVPYGLTSYINAD